MACHFSGGTGRGVLLFSILSPRCSLPHVLTAQPASGTGPGRTALGKRPCSDIWVRLLSYVGILWDQVKTTANLLSVEYLCGFFWMQIPQCRPWSSLASHSLSNPWFTVSPSGGLIISSRWSSCPGPEVVLGNFLSSNSWSVGDTHTHCVPWGTGSTFISHMPQALTYYYQRISPAFPLTSGFPGVGDSLPSQVL